MSSATEVATFAGFLKSSYLAVRSGGGVLPEHLNLANLAEAVDSIPTAPTLEGLKNALRDDTASVKYPVGTEIPDTYDGQSNPLIVAQYLNSRNNSKYAGANGVILIRKFVEPIEQAFGRYQSNTAYGNSLMKDFLDSTYLNNCSSSLKPLLATWHAPMASGSLAGKWFPMSAIEVGGKPVNTEDAFMWDYWKYKTGWSTASNNPNSGRIMKSRDGIARDVWLRAPGYSNMVYFVESGGGISTNFPTVFYGVLPACFIAKD